MWRRLGGGSGGWGQADGQSHRERMTAGRKVPTVALPPPAPPPPRAGHHRGAVEGAWRLMEGGKAVQPEKRREAGVEAGGSVALDAARAVGTARRWQRRRQGRWR